MIKTPKFLLTSLAVLGLASAPTVTLTNNAPVPQAPAPQQDPAGKTDARSTRYYVPKGVRQRARSRFTHFLHACFDARLPNRWVRRSVARAAYAGRGQASEGWAKKGQPILVREVRDPETGKLTGARQTTRRAAERAARARSMGFVA